MGYAYPGLASLSARKHRLAFMTTRKYMRIEIKKTTKRRKENSKNRLKFFSGYENSKESYQRFFLVYMIRSIGYENWVVVNQIAVHHFSFRSVYGPTFNVSREWANQFLISIVYFCKISNFYTTHWDNIIARLLFFIDKLEFSNDSRRYSKWKILEYIPHQK